MTTQTMVENDLVHHIYIMSFESISFKQHCIRERGRVQEKKGNVVCLVCVFREKRNPLLSRIYKD